MLKLDRILAILGLLLAIPGVLVLFQSPHKEAGFLFASILCLVFAYTSHFYWWEFRQSFFTHFEVNKTVTFQDPQARVVRVETRIKSRVNHSGITQLWFRNFQPGDKYRRVTVDERPPGSTKTKGGSLDFCKEFDRPQTSQGTFETKVSYEVHDAFPLTNPDEFFITHVVGTPTKLLRLRVRFHNAKIGRNVRGVVTGLSGAERIREIPVDSELAQYEIRNPRIGSRHTIEWEW